MPFLPRLRPAVPSLRRAAGREAAGIARTAAAVVSRRHSSSVPPRATVIDKLHREETAAERIKQARQNAAQERRNEQEAESDATVNVSVATVLVRRKVDNQQEDLEQAISSQYYPSALNEAVLPENVLGASGIGNMVDLAESVAEELKRGWHTHATRPSRTAENKDSKSPPSQRLRPSIDEDELSSGRVRVSDLKPLPFQTLHPSVQDLQEKSSQEGKSAKSAGQIDWLEDVDDVSGHASEIVSSLRGSDDGVRSPIGGAAHLTGDLPYMDVGEAIDDTSLDDATRQHLPQDYMRAYARNVHTRNKVGDHDYGYGDSRPQEREQLKAKHIPYVDPQAVRTAKKQRPKDLAQQVAPDVGGTMNELSHVDDAGIVNDGAQRAGAHAYRRGQQKTSIGEAALRAKSKEGAEQDVHTGDRSGKR